MERSDLRSKKLYIKNARKKPFKEIFSRVSFKRPMVLKIYLKRRN